MADRYVLNPLPMPVGRPFDIAVVNAGPNEFSAFHVVGSILRNVEESGNPLNHLYDVSTYAIAPGEGGLIPLKFSEPGEYSFVSHDMAQIVQKPVLRPRDTTRSPRVGT